MADLRYKVVVDDAEAKRKLSELLKGTGVSSPMGGMSEDAKKAAASIDQVRAATIRVKEAQEANIKALRQARLERAEQIKNQAELNARYKQGQIDMQEFRKEQAKLTAEEKKRTKEARELKKALAENSEYSKLTKALNNVRKETKDVLAEMYSLERQGKKNSAGYQELANKARGLTAQTKLLDQGVKKIDATVGQHQRNVGNYASAMDNMVPIIGRVNMQLANFGTSLDSLANKPNAIKELGVAFVGLGKSILAFLATPVGATIAGLATLFALFQRNKQTVIDFDSGMKNVSKTTGLAGADLTRFGDAIVDLSMKLQVVSADKLLEYATVAGQLGVKGREDILAFTEALAMLETASDIKGEEGGREIARLLTLVDGGVRNVKDFGDEIVNLGNNFAATEAEILANATRIAQSTGIYKIGRQEVLAYATATKSVGVEAELVGSTIGRTLGILEKVIRTGKGVDTVLKLVGGTQAQLSSRFRDDASGVLTDFIGGLSKIEGGAAGVNKALSAIGISAIRDRTVLGALATNGYDVLTSSLENVRGANGAMQEEFENGASKLEQQTKRMSIAWDNFVLSIENGEGLISKAFLRLIDGASILLDQINKTFNPTSADEFVARLTSFKTADFIRELDKAMDAGGGQMTKLGSFEISKSSQREINDMAKETESALGTVTAAYNKYKEAVESGELTKAGKHSLEDFDQVTRVLSSRLSQLKMFVREAEVKPGTGGTPEEQAEADEKAQRAAERAAEAQRRAVERQRALQLQIDQINQQSLRGQLSRDEQEVASIRDKYAKIREEVRKFYADPKNKGLKVNMSGIAQAEDFEVSEATTRQGTKELVQQLNEQKSIYDEYNAYVERNGVEAADKLFGKQAEIAKSYRAELDAEYISLLGKQKSASTGGAAVSSLTQAEEERFKQLQAMRDVEAKNEEVKTRIRMDAALKMAQSFNDKRLEIERKYQQAREALGDKITPEQEQELQRKEAKDLSQLASTELQESEAWQKLFSDLDALTVSQIDNLVKEIEAKFDDLSVNFDPIDLASIRSRLNEARDMIIADNPFAAVGAAIREIFNSSADDSKVSAEDIKRNWSNLAKATESSFDFINNAVGSTELLKDALGDVGQMTLSSLQSIASAGIAVASAVKTAGETMTAVEKASVVLAAVQAALVVVQAITSFLDGAAKRRNEELAKEQEYYNALSDTFDILIGKQKELFSERSGKGAMDAYKEALDLVNSKQIANRKSLEAWFAQGASWKSHSNWYNYDKELGNVLSRQRLLNMTGEEWNNLLRDQPTLWARLPEEVKAFGSSMIAAKGEAEQLRDAIQESITGISLDDVKSEFENLFSQADLTFGDISDSFYKHMQKAVLRMVQDGAMTDRMKAWYDNLMTAMDDENLTKAESDALKADYQAIVEAGQKRTKEIMDLIGYEPNEGGGAIQGRINPNMTESTGSEILGFERARYDIAKKSYDMMTLQVSNQQKYITIANDKLVALNAIQINTANTVQRLDTAVVHLQQIVRNTGGTTGRTAEGMGL